MLLLIIFSKTEKQSETSREQLKSFITERLPTAIAKTCTSLDLITQKAWETVANAERNHDEKIKLQALSLIKETEADKIEIVSNVYIVDQLISTVEEKEKQKQPLRFVEREEEEIEQEQNEE